MTGAPVVSQDTPMMTIKILTNSAAHQPEGHPTFNLKTNAGS
jgi:hypothetical protein